MKKVADWIVEQVNFAFLPNDNFEFIGSNLIDLFDEVSFAIVFDADLAAYKRIASHVL